MKANGTRRERGAYFTPRTLARFLAEWGIRSPADQVLDPAAGDGALVGAAAERLRALECERPGVTGVELHVRTHKKLAALARSAGIPSKRMLRGDFFRVWRDLGKFDVVLANPPYVRHHDIPKKAGSRMRSVVSETGSDISGRASSWAYFVLTAMRMLKAGGRLCAVLPSELVNADYGRQVLAALQRQFRSVLIVRCDGRPFAQLQLTTLALLADGYTPGSDDSIGIVRVCSVDASALCIDPPPLEATQALPDGNRAASVVAGGATSDDWLVFEEAVALGVGTLNDCSTIHIGYVSGDNEFFHLSERERLEVGIGEEHLRRIVPRGSLLQGTAFTLADWDGLREGDSPCWVLSPLACDNPPIQRYLRKGVRSGVSDRQKCRTRRPWWRIALGESPGAVLVFMGHRPRIVSNHLQAWASNSLYTVDVQDGLEVHQLAVASMTSLFQLACALLARRLGGGLAKLEIRDTAALPTPVAPVDTAVGAEIDRLVRGDRWWEAVALADEEVLRGALGVCQQRIAGWQKRLAELVQRD